MNSYRISRPNTNGRFPANIRLFRSTTNTFENNVQPSILVLKQQLRFKDSVFKGDPREFLG